LSDETSGGSISDTCAVGASEIRLPHRERMNDVPSVTSFSPLCNWTFFFVQYTVSFTRYETCTSRGCASTTVFALRTSNPA
jgi:hypothetical protein